MEEAIQNFFQQLVYQPYVAYFSILGFMTICALGVPIPEEVVIISAGYIGHMALSSETLPPYPGAHSVDPYTLAAVTFASVIVTDYIIFFIGRKFGPRIMSSQRFKKYFTEEKKAKITTWTQKYGIFAPGVFRFIPGVRFPGHMMCGALGLPAWQFLLTDGLAALISVPTQVLLVSFYGKDILLQIAPYKKMFLITLVLVVVSYLFYKFWLSKRVPSAQN